MGSNSALLIPQGYREVPVGSEMPKLIPKWTRNGVQKGCLGSGTPKLIPQRPSERLRGSESRDLIPKGACGWGAKGQMGLEMLILSLRGHQEVPVGSG